MVGVKRRVSRALVSTAQGDTMAAAVTLNEMHLGDIALDHVPAEVMREDGAASLLGMSFLDRLDGYEVRRDSLALHGAR